MKASNVIAGLFRHTYNSQQPALEPIRFLLHDGALATCAVFTSMEDGDEPGKVALIIGSQASQRSIEAMARKQGIEVSALLQFARRESIYA